MEIKRIDEQSYHSVASLMSEIKPEFWDYDGAIQQIRDTFGLTKLIGWYMEKDYVSKGWISCAEYDGYSCLSIETLGYNDNGQFIVDQPLEPLLRTAEDYAISKGYRCLKFIIGSTDMSCHGKLIKNYAFELENLKVDNRKDYEFFKSYGFIPTGFIPNCYGKNFHGVIMIKPLI